MDELQKIDCEPTYVDNDEPIVLHERLEELLAYQLKHNPRLKGKTKKDIANGCYISETCLKNMLNGTNDNPRIGTLKTLLRYIGGGSIDVLIGFAPARDYKREEHTYDTTIVAGLQARLEEKRERIAELVEQQKQYDADRERMVQLVRELSSDLSTYKERAAHFEHAQREIGELHSKLAAEQKMARKARNMQFAVVAMAVVVLGIAAWLIWEIAHIDMGLFSVR